MLLKDLQTLATKLATGTLFHVEKAGKAYSVDYSALAKAIIEEYADSTVGGSKQSVQAAIGALNSSLTKYRIQYNATYSVNGAVYHSPSISQALDAIASKGAGRYCVECISSASYADTYNSSTASNLTLIVDAVSTNYINVLGIAIGNQYGITMYRTKSSSWGNWIKQPIRDEIDALNSSLTTAAGTPTVPSGCTLVDGGYWVFGKWVFLDAIVKVDEAKAMYDTILGGIPTLYTPGTSAPISACVSNVPRVAMVSNSNVYVGGSIASIPAGATVRITGCYYKRN